MRSIGGRQMRSIGGRQMRSIGGKQMRSISGMPSAEMAGAAKRDVPLPERNAFRRNGRCRKAGRAVTREECLPPKWQVPQSGACRYHVKGGIAYGWKNRLQL